MSESGRPPSQKDHTPGQDGDGGKGGSAREPGGGILMGRFFGVPIYVAPSWFLVAALITWVFGGQLDTVLPELGGVDADPGLLPHLTGGGLGQGLAALRATADREPEAIAAAVQFPAELQQHAPVGVNGKDACRVAPYP